MLEESANEAMNAQIANIDAAAAILRRMLVELQGLEAKCARLHFAMSNSGHSIRQELDMLSGVAELLKSGQAPLRNQELSRRGKALISHLAAELEQLSLQTEHDLRIDHLASLPHCPAAGEARAGRLRQQAENRHAARRTDKHFPVRDGGYHEFVSRTELITIARRLVAVI
jgi:hypothetical protein